MTDNQPEKNNSYIAPFKPELSVDFYFNSLLEDREEIKSLPDGEQKVILLMENTALIWQLLLYKDEDNLCDESECESDSPDRFKL